MFSQLIAAAAPAAAATAAAAKAAAGKATAAPLPVNAVPQQLPPATVVPQTWFQQHAGWATHGIAGIFILSCIALVVLLALQTTKQEGLSGTVGGAVQSAYRGRPGAEEQLKTITAATAIIFVITGFILSITGI